MPNRPRPPRPWRMRSGRAVFTGTSVPVSELMDCLEHGDSVEDFLEQHPEIDREQVDGVFRATRRELDVDGPAR